MKGGASARGGRIAPGKNCAREVIEKYRSGSIRKSRLFFFFFNIISALLFAWSERVGYIIYVYSRDRGRRIERGEKRDGAKKRQSEKKRTVIRIRARREGRRTGVRGRDANTKTKEETKLR